MASELIKDGATTKKSRLIHAMKGWNTSSFFTDLPKGVFGSEATIKCNGAVIKSSELDIEFDIPFDDDMEYDEAEIIIYNLNDTTKSRLTKEQKITVEAGFKGDTGVIFTGYISKTSTKYEGVDRKTTLICLDRLNETELTETTYKAGTKASAILKSLLQKTGTPIAVFKVRNDYTFKDEQKVDGNLMENIKKYADICGISVYVSQGKIYARYLKEGDNLNFTVKEETGLIGSPTEYEEENTANEDKPETIKGYEIETIMQHRFRAGGIVTLKSRDASGQFRIRSGAHTFRSGEATSRIKVF